MPGYDGTGPAGAGPMTGRGMGNCAEPVDENGPAVLGRRLGWFGRGAGRGLGPRRYLGRRIRGGGFGGGR